MSPASATAEKHVASYKVMLNGAELKQELMDSLGEIKVVDSLMLPDTCDLTLFLRELEEVDSQPFKIGTTLVIKAGAIDDPAPTTTVFDGEVAAIDADFGHGGVTLGIRAYDKGHKLTRNRKVRVFQKQTFSDIVKAVAGESGLSVEADPSGDPQDWVQQDNETDWDFIWRLARRINFWVLIEGNKLSFKDPSVPGNAVSIEAEYPLTLASFHPRVTAVQQVKEVTARAWDPKTKTVFSATAANPEPLAEIGLSRSKVADDGGGGKLHISNSSATTKDEITRIAKGTLDRVANAYVEADGQIPGNPKVKAGVTLDVKGIGSQFSGKYLVGTVRHSFEGGGSFDTHVSTATATPGSLATLAGGNGKLKFGDQLVVGIVTNNKDPDNLARVKVKFPTMDDQLETDWMRIATPSAGKERGLLMLPQVNEEVLVGFENGDTRRGFIIGSLFNGKDKPHTDHIHDNDGSFVVLSDKQVVATSKDEMKLTSTKKMTVEVKDAQEIKVTKDRTENVQGGLTHSVGGNFKSDAKGSGSLKATGSYTIESSASVTIKAPSVTVEGQASLTLKAPQVNIQGSAMVNISGGLINLG